MLTQTRFRVGPMTIELFFRKYRRDAVDLDIPDKYDLIPNSITDALPRHYLFSLWHLNFTFREPEDGEYNPDHPERRDEELLDTRLEEVSRVPL